MDKETWSKIYQGLIFVCALGCLIIGAIGFAGWYYHDISLLQVIHSSSAMRFTTATLIILSGFALLFQFIENRLINITFYIGIVILIISSITLVEYFFHTDLTLDELLINTFLTPESQSFLQNPDIEDTIRPAFLTAVAFSLAGLAFVLSRRRTGVVRNSIIMLLGLLLCCISAVAFLSFIVPIKTNIIFQKHTVGMAFLTTIAIQFIGLGIIFSSALINLKKDYNWDYLKPYLTGIVLLCLTLLITLGVYAQKVAFIDFLTEEKSQLIKERIKNYTHEQVNQLCNLKPTLDNSPKLASNPHWIQEASLLLKKGPQFDAIYLLDDYFAILSVIPPELQEKEIAKDLPLGEPEHTTLMKMPVNTFEILYRPIDNHLLFVSPMITNKDQHGYMIGVSNATSFFNIPLSQVGGEFTVQVFIGSELVSELNPTDTLNTRKWSKIEKLNINGLDLAIKVFPKLETVVEHINIEGTYATVLVCLILCLLGSLLVYALELNKKRLRQIEQIQEVLHDSKEKLNLAIKAANITTWTGDLKKREVAWDENAYVNFFGQTKDFVLPTKFKDVLQYIYPPDQKAVAYQWNTALATDQTSELTFRVLHPDHSVHYLSSRAVVFFDEKGVPSKSAGICWDVTEDIRSHKLMRIQYRTSQILNDASTDEIVMPKLLKLLGEELELGAAVFWLRDPKDNVLHCSYIWENPQIDLTAFREACFKHHFAKGSGFPGHVWEVQRPVTQDNIVTDQHFLRAKEAEKATIQSVFGIPIYETNTVYGIIELFKLTPFIDEVNEYFLNLSDFISTELGQFEKRRKFEESRSQLASIVDFSREAIISQDMGGHITTWNKGAEQFLGYTAHETLNQSIEILFPQDMKQRWQSILSEVKQGVAINNLETVLVRKDGQKVQALTTISPMFENNVIVGANYVSQDISELKKAQEILQESEEKFRVFVETTGNWIWAIDKHRKITFSNPSVKTILGYRPEDIKDTDMLLLVADEQRYKKEQEIDLAIDRRRGWNNEITQWKHKNGTLKWLESSAEPILNDADEVVGFRGAERDVTERISLEKIKNEFISMVSHELRTPLTSIKGAIGLIIGKSDLSPERRKQLLDIAANNCERLMAIINDILEVERMEAGRFEVRLQVADIDKIIADCIEANTPFANKFGTELVLEEAPKDVKVYTDTSRLIQVLTNLISNAVKFSPPKSKVFLRVDSSPTSVCVSVRDQGPGIEEELQTHIFEKFYRGDVVGETTTPGTGLGLNISKNIIERLGGSIHFSTKKGQGSVFYFVIPRWYEATPLIHAHDLKKHSPSILIISKEEATTNVIEETLRQNEFASNKHSSSDNLKKLLNQPGSTAVIIDLSELSPQQVEELKQYYTADNPHPPLILITDEESSASLKSAKNFDSVPIWGIIEKPINSLKFNEMIHKLRDKLVSEMPHMLYVESDYNLVELMKNIFQDKVHLYPAQTIKIARDILKTIPIDIILLDLYLPDGLGVELLPARRLGKTEAIPVIIFSNVIEETKTFPDNVVKVLIKSRTSEQELTDTVMAILKSSNSKAEK